MISCLAWGWVTARCHASPGVAVQNNTVVYQFDSDPALGAAENLFNQTVQRVNADPQARRRNGPANVTPTTGNLKIPMLTLHTLGDLFVPFVMEQEYARRVQAKGYSHNLVQRATRALRPLRLHSHRLGADLHRPGQVGGDRYQASTR